MEKNEKEEKEEKEKKCEKCGAIIADKEDVIMIVDWVRKKEIKICQKCFIKYLIT